MYNDVYLVIRDYIAWPQVQPTKENKNMQEQNYSFHQIPIVKSSFIFRSFVKV